MSDQFKRFQERLQSLRDKSKDFGDKEQIETRLDDLEAVFLEAAKATSLAESQQVKAALEATQRTADIIAHNILFCDTSAVTPQQLIGSIAKFQALEQVRAAFKPAAAEALLAATEKMLEDKEA